jgi:F-type H+-transporting ATPase subunit delta
MSNAVARRYAKSLSDLAHSEGCLETIATDLSGIVTLLSDSLELRSALGNPSIPLSERSAVLKTVLAKLGAHKITCNFMSLLLDNNRLVSLSDINSAFEQNYDERIGRVRARVCSAVALDKATLEALEKHLLAVTGKEQILLETEVDASLVGGIVTHVGDLVFDGSIRTQLNLLQNKLLSQETPAQA